LLISAPRHYRLTTPGPLPIQIISDRQNSAEKLLTSNYFITSIKEVVFLPEFVCLSVS